MFKIKSIFAMICSFLYVNSSKSSLISEKEDEKNEVVTFAPFPKSIVVSEERKKPSPLLIDCLSSDPVFINSKPVGSELQGKTKKSSATSRSSSPKDDSKARILLRDKDLIFSQDTSRSEEIKRITQARLEHKKTSKNQESKLPTLEVCNNTIASSAGTSPRERERKSSRAKDLFSSSSPRFCIDDDKRTRKSSEGKKLDEEHPLIVPIELSIPLRSEMKMPKITLKIPETHVPTSIVLTFHFQEPEVRENTSPKRVSSAKKKVRSSKNSPRTPQADEDQFLFDEEFGQINKVFGVVDPNPELFSLSVMGSGQTVSLWDSKMLDQMICHTKKHHLLFSEDALKKTDMFLKNLEYFVGLQMLLRADNQYMFEYLKELHHDYFILAQISDSEIEEKQKTDLLIGISNCHNNICVSANKGEKSRYQNQHDSINIILCEYVELYEKWNDHFSKVESLNPKLIRENAQTISIVHNFVSEHFSMLKNIELERSDFLHFLDIFFGNTKREIRIESALEGFSSLIERHEHAAQQREKLNLSNLVLDAGELKATLSEKVSLLKKSDAGSSHHDTFSDDGKKHKRGLTPPRSEGDVSSQRK